MLRRLKWMLYGLIVLTIMIIALQNLNEVETRILFVTFKTSQATLLVGSMALGFLLGILFRTLRRVTRRRNEAGERSEE